MKNAEETEKTVVNMFLERQIDRYRVGSWFVLRLAIKPAARTCCIVYFSGKLNMTFCVSTLVESSEQVSGEDLSS